MVEFLPGRATSIPRLKAIRFIFPYPEQHARGNQLAVCRGRKACPVQWYGARRWDRPAPSCSREHKFGTDMLAARGVVAGNAQVAEET